jgi:hypothetical protein
VWNANGARRTRFINEGGVFLSKKTKIFIVLGILWHAFSILLIKQLTRGEFPHHGGVKMDTFMIVLAAVSLVVVAFQISCGIAYHEPAKEAAVPSNACSEA